MKTLCRISEFLKLQRLVWSLILIFAAIGFLVSLLALLSRIVVDHDIPLITSTLNRFAELLPISPEVEGVLRSISLTMLPLAITFGFVVCRQRQAVIDALVLGYWKNYLSHLLKGTTLDLVIVRATYGLYQDPDLFIGQLKRKIQDELGIELVDEFLHGAQRTGFRAYQDGVASDVVFDFSRNLIPLGAIVDSELGKPLGGTFCKPEYKFDFIVEKIYQKLQDDWLTRVDLSGRVRIVSHEELHQLGSILSARMHAASIRT